MATQPSQGPAKKPNRAAATGSGRTSGKGSGKTSDKVLAKKPGTGMGTGPSAQASPGEALDFTALRTAVLEPWRPFLHGNRFASLVAVKGIPGRAEQSGQPFFGADGEALESALLALGWQSNSWCGIVLELPDRAQLTAAELRLLVETIDPRALLALDRPALRGIQEGFGEELLPRVPEPGQKCWLLGRALVFVDGFEAALVSDDGGEAKRRVWRELKALKTLKVQGN
ncbi:MAG: hypothetical protein LBL23_07375 [Coriobacteriales bacterium]|jgi:hypothetical protein|nr:hypothetical protein [Coriobacteriales bacterium]